LTATDSNNQLYDVIIAGAGIVGATLANALAGKGLRIGVIEKNEPLLNWEEGSIDLRVSAITEASQHIFQHLKVWPTMKTLGISPFHSMHVWNTEGTGEIHFDCADIGAPQLGHIIENRVMQSALLSRLSGIDSVELKYQRYISHIHHYDDYIAVQLDDGSTQKARLLVGADGGRSSVRQMAGIEISAYGYQQEAIVTVVEPEKAHMMTAWQHFLPAGPLAFLPLADGRCSIVWSTSPAQAQQLLQCNEKDFCLQLETAFDQRLGSIKHCEQRLSFPLRRQHAKRYIDQRLALIGDAAHTIHPLAGQGVNLGLLDAATLAQVILNPPDHQDDFASQRNLRRYERWRRGDNLITMSVMDGFKHLFGSTNNTVDWFRNCGLGLTNQLPFLKNGLIKKAMGRKSDLPNLAEPGF